MASTITLHDKQFRKYITSAKIQKAISVLAKKINADYKNECPVFVSVLNGSFMFTADLLKKVKINCEVSFVKVASYSGAQSTGNVNTLIGLTNNLKGRSVIVLEDIVDSGNTIVKLMRELKKQKPKNIHVATLFFKPEAYQGTIPPDYIGIKVPNDFIVGYGLDYDQLGRNLSDIYILKS